VPLSRRDCLTCVARGPECFCHLPHAALADLQTRGRTIRLIRGQQLLHEGDGPDVVYLVCAGHLKLYASSPEGKVLLLRMAAPGDVMGLAAALRGTRQKLTIEALDACELKSMRRADFLDFAGKYREAGANASQAMAREFDAALISARRLALSGSANAKVASLIMELAELNQPNSGIRPIEIPMPLTHEELGSMCGLSRETVTRALSKFSSEGLLQQATGRLVVLDPAGLEAHFA